MFECFNLHNDQQNSPDKNLFIEILNLCTHKKKTNKQKTTTTTEVCKMNDFFVLKISLNES